MPNDTMSYGEKAVGLTFNPSGDPRVAELKKMFADIIDACASGRDAAISTEVKRLYSIAITEAQTAQMWGVKAITWTDGNDHAEDTRRRG